MINRFEIYGLILLGLILAALAAGAYERHVGYQERADQDASDLLKANNKVDTLNGQLQSISSTHAAELAQQAKDNAAQLAGAIAGVKPVIVRVPTASGLQTGDPTGATGGVGGQQPANGGVSTNFDIAPAELVFGAKYQTCRDSLNTYIQFYADLKKKVAAR